jgi:aminopeptidase N
VAPERFFGPCNDSAPTRGGVSSNGQPLRVDPIALPAVPASARMNGHRGCGWGHRCGGRGAADPAGGPRPFALPGDPQHFRRARPFDVTHLRLELALDVPGRGVHGAASLTFARRDPTARVLPLDAVGFTVESVSLEETGAALPFAYDGEALQVTLGELRAGVLRVAYRARPRRGLYFIAPDADAPARPAQVWSQCQDEDARHWFPCHDAPDMRMTTELVVTAPAGWTVLSNGALLGRAPAGADAERWHWRQDTAHPSYLVTLVAGTFAELDATRDPALPVRFYVDPGREAEGWRSLGRTAGMIEHFSALTGVPYPWPRYDQVTVHDFTFGGMENTSISTLTERCLLDERAALDATADDLVAHELAHQWFGDLVTCQDWSHAWLNEGFATFFEHLDVERKDGRDAYLYNLKLHADAYFGEDDARYRRPVVCATWGAPIDLFDRHLYEKGGWVLHMLRSELGDAVFWEGVREYLTRHRGRSVETRDLERAMEDASGRALGEFFQQWIHRAGHPELEFDARFEAGAGLLYVVLRQTQAVDAVTPRFRLAVAVSVVLADGAEQAHTLTLDDRSRTFALPCAAAPRWVALDPEGALLAKVTTKLPAAMLRDALEGDARAAVRWRAAAALARHDDEATVAALERALRGDAFWGVSAEAARTLGEVRGARAWEALLRAVDHAHPKVRRAVARALGEFRTDAAAALLVARLEAGDASWLVESELARAAGRTRRPAAYAPLVAALARESWRDVVRVGAAEGLGALRDARAIPALLALTAPAAGHAARRAAVAALAELGDDRRDVREALELLLEERDPHLVPEVLRALARLRDGASVEPVSRVLRMTDDGRVRRAAREALRALQARDGAEEMKRLRDDLDALRDELRGVRDQAAAAAAARDTRRPAAGKRKR